MTALQRSDPGACLPHDRRFIRKRHRWTSDIADTVPADPALNYYFEASKGH